MLLRTVLNIELFTKISAGILFLLFLALPAAAFAESSEITLYAGGFLGSSFIYPPTSLTGPVEGKFDDEFTLGFRYAYFFKRQLAAEFGLGFSPSSIATVA